MNQMRQIKIAKVVLNIGLGKNVDRLDAAKRLAEKLTGCKPIQTIASRRAKTFKVGRNRVIGVKVTMRGPEAVEFLKKLLIAKENILKSSSFDKEGNFNFGFNEYLEIPGIKYDPSIGILGFNVSVTLERPGFRIKRRKIQKKKLPMSHRLSKDESVEFVKNELGVEIV